MEIKYFTLLLYLPLPKISRVGGREGSGEGSGESSGKGSGKDSVVCVICDLSETSGDLYETGGVRWCSM